MRFTSGDSCGLWIRIFALTRFLTERFSVIVLLSNFDVDNWVPLGSAPEKTLSNSASNCKPEEVIHQLRNEEISR